MEIFESAAYIALGFIPTLGLLEIAYRMGMKIRRRKGVVIGRGGLTTNKVIIANSFQDINKMYSSTLSFRKYFNKQTLSGISSHFAAKKLILRCPKLRLNFGIKRIFELIAYNGAYGMTPYSGAGLEMYFYCNYRDEYE
jgi:hypothetical protein